MNTPKSKHDRLKLALIPVLGLVLIAVLPESETDSPQAAVAQPAAATPPASVSVPESLPSAAKGAAAASAASTAEVAWPRAPLKSVLKHDPFVFSDPRALLDQAFLAAGMTAPVQMEEVTPEEFFPPTVPAAVSAEDEDVWTALMEFFPESVLPPVAEPKQPTSAREPVTDQPSDELVELENALLREEALARERQAAALQKKLMQQQRLQQRLQAIARQPVTMYMQSPAGHSVLLGDRRVAVGELVEDGIRVRTIDRHGITFELVDPVAAAQEPSLQ